MLGHPEWVDDPRFATSDLLFSNGAEAAALIAEAFLTADQATWKQRLQGIKGQWAPVQDTLDIADDPMVEANGYLGEATTADGIPSRSSPRRCSSTGNRRRRREPRRSTGRATTFCDQSWGWTKSRSSI